MGNSASATLFFGAPFEARDDEHGSHEDLGGWEDKLAAARGVLPPSEPFGSGSDPAIKAKYRAYWAAKRDVVEAEPCAVYWAGTYDESSYYVYVKETSTRVEWGPPGRVGAMESTPEQTEALVEFCRVMGIQHDEGFDWHLAAFYG